MAVPRSEIIERLVMAASEGMGNVAQGTTAEEVISAALTLALRHVKYAVRHGADVTALRLAIQRILVECTDGKTN